MLLDMEFNHLCNARKIYWPLGVGLTLIRLGFVFVIAQSIRQWSTPSQHIIQNIEQILFSIKNL